MTDLKAITYEATGKNEFMKIKNYLSIDSLNYFNENSNEELLRPAWTILFASDLNPNPVKSEEVSKTDGSVAERRLRGDIVRFALRVPVLVTVFINF